MGNLLKTGASWLATQLKSHASESVTYARGANTATIAATIGSNDQELDTEDGSIVDFRTRDFIFNAADLVISGSATTPQKGDVIKQTIGGVVHKFEVLPIDNEKWFRYSDAYGNRFRVHTEFIGTE